jgi:hypothetical protein
MARDDARARRILGWASLLLLAAPAAAVGALSAQGLTPQGLTPQGLTPQGLTPQGLTPQGLTPQGLTPQGISPQGISPQGLTPQGLTPQGITSQGQQTSGAALFGSDLTSVDLRGVEIGSVEMRGTRSDSPLVPFELTSGPGISTGGGDYISVAGASAVGHYAVAHLVDPTGQPAEDLDLFIAGEAPDPAPNLLHRGGGQINEDVTLYTVYFFHRWSGTWASLCPFHPVTGGATAMAIAEDPGQPNRFIFACTASGVAAKCARAWGFRPWRTDHAYVWDDASNEWVDRSFALKPFYDACKLAARAAYCQDRQSFTRNGTLIDLFDTRQLVWPNAVENPFGADPGSRWMLAQEFFVSVDPLAERPQLKASALQRTRYRDLSPNGRCADLAFVDRLEQDHFEDGRWASPLTGTPRVEVFSPNYCGHGEHEVGAGLAWDCSPCTTAVCKTQPRCCRLDGAAGTRAWDALCAAAADQVCDDPPGRVWPRDLDAPAAAPQKLLLGAFGAVERIDSPGAGNVTVSGWACDPEWPGAAVTVAVYGTAPREQSGSQLLGLAYADRALAAPLAREVSVACDGPDRGAARHGFSFALPPGAAGQVFFYALDAETPDGPPPPPALLRNGIVTVPSAGGAGGAFAAVLTGWFQAPRSGSYLFSADSEPSRLFVNGRKLVDWWDGPGASEGSINLLAGSRYHLRWDRFASQPPPDAGAPGVTWRPPGATAPAAIPAALLYRLAPGAGQGLDASYFDRPGFAGPAIDRVDATVDLGSEPPAGQRLPGAIAPSSFSVVWQGEIVPLYSDSYTFLVTSAGQADLQIAGQALLPPEVSAPALAPACAHDICALGDKLTASTSLRAACHPCVDQICAHDPFCCDGGYLSYYSSEPVWDARCVAEVGARCGLSCENPLPSPTTRQRDATPISLQAGVRYPIRLAVDNPGDDVNTQLAWSSARQGREVVPRTALFAASAAAGASVGAGLNVVLFGVTNVGGVTRPDLETPLASGSAPDLSLARPLAPAGSGGAPGAGVLAPSDDASAGTPAPPAVVSPRFGDHSFQPVPQVLLTVLGGIRGGSLRARVTGTAIDVVLPFDAQGDLRGAAVPLASYGPQTLTLSQRTYAGSTCAPSPGSVCAESAAIDWRVVVDAQSPPSPPAPEILAPRDPASIPDPADNVVAVRGRGLPGPVAACDRGGIGQAGVIAQSLQAAADGTISGTVTLTAGSQVSPSAGWHKLALSQDNCATMGKPVFISIGVRPATVEFPRSGAPGDCSLGGVAGQIIARGTIPYAPDSFGPLIIGEELGRLTLGLIAATVTVDPTPRPDGSFAFQALLPILAAGQHLLYFFQAPPAPANATQADIDAHLRAFASIARTPRSRIALPVLPIALGLPVVGPVLGGVLGPVLGAVGCALQPGAACALPNADVNVRDGNRLWTTRADTSGDWQISLPDLSPGWHALTFTQVVDSPAGGGWVESCPSSALPVGMSAASISGAPAPQLTLPGGLVTDALSLAGAVVQYGAAATTAAGAPAPVDCQPAPGTLFPIGATNVLCTAVDPTTQAVEVGSFPVSVVDGPPVLNVPAQDIVAEADSVLGALVGYEVTASDAVSGPLPVDCSPSASPAAPALFPLGIDTTVVCEATDGAGQTTTRSFVVRVRDTTPPTLTLPAQAVQAVAVGKQGVSVSYAASAHDVADPSPTLACTPASGSGFALGTTSVSCSATDGSGNRSTASFSVVVTVSWSNLLAPIDLLGTATFLRPSPVAVQFSLTGGSAGITDLPARLFLAPVDSSGRVGAEHPALGLAPGVGNLFRFVPLVHQYLLSLNTVGTGAGTWQLRVDLGDGVVRTARIRLL